MKLNVYEYTIKDSKLGNYKGSYTVIAGCPNESILKAKFNSKLVQSFDHEKRSIHIPSKERIVLTMTNNAE